MAGGPTYKARHDQLAHDAHARERGDRVRARVANGRRGADLVPIDCPEPDYRDLAHFERDICHARQLGYRGKYCIHPTQVEIANDGAMVDRSIYVRAIELLALRATLAERTQPALASRAAHAPDSAEVKSLDA